MKKIGVEDRSLKKIRKNRKRKLEEKYVIRWLGKGNNRDFGGLINLGR